MQAITPQRILLIGGPSTGKTTLIEQLKSQNHQCLDEVSREVIQKAQAAGIDQLFLEQPLLFSELLLEARIAQHQEVSRLESPFVFMDRGIPDTVAYMEYINQSYPPKFVKACRHYRYDAVFVLPPWEEIHTTDAERYEDFDTAQQLHAALMATYRTYDYHPITVPKTAVEQRARFILDQLELD